jgi:hypothetical protein
VLYFEFFKCFLVCQNFLLVHFQRLLFPGERSLQFPNFFFCHHFLLNGQPAALYRRIWSRLLPLRERFVYFFCEWQPNGNNMQSAYGKHPMRPVSRAVHLAFSFGFQGSQHASASLLGIYWCRHPPFVVSFAFRGLPVGGSNGTALSTTFGSRWWYDSAQVVIVAVAIAVIVVAKGS